MLKLVILPKIAPLGSWAARQKSTLAGGLGLLPIIQFLFDDRRDDLGRDVLVDTPVAVLYGVLEIHVYFAGLEVHQMTRGVSAGVHGFEIHLIGPVEIFIIGIDIDLMAEYLELILFHSFQFLSHLVLLL